MDIWKVIVYLLINLYILLGLMIIRLRRFRLGPGEISIIVGLWSREVIWYSMPRYLKVYSLFPRLKRLIMMIFSVGWIDFKLHKTNLQTKKKCNKNNKTMKINQMMNNLNSMTITSKITNNNKKQKESKCKWEPMMSYNFRMKSSILLRKFWEKSLKIIKALKILRLASGMNLKIYLKNTIEFIHLSIWTGLTKMLLLKTNQKVSHTQICIFLSLWKGSLRTLFSSTQVFIQLSWYFYSSTREKWLSFILKSEEIPIMLTTIQLLSQINTMPFL